MHKIARRLELWKTEDDPDSETFDYTFTTLDKPFPPTGPATTHTRQLSRKYYEISNHLGNILATVSDKKSVILDFNQYNVASLVGYAAEVLSVSDYYPFGSAMPGRSLNLGEYRFGFQAQEADGEVYGTGNAVSYKYRVEETRLGRFLSVDPLAAEYPFYSPYAFSGNRVLDAVELEGLEPFRVPATSPASQSQMRVIRGGQYGKGSSQPFNPGDPVSQRAIKYVHPASPTVESQVNSLLTWKLLADWFFPQEKEKYKTPDVEELQQRVDGMRAGYGKNYTITLGFRNLPRIQEAFDNFANGEANAEDINIINHYITPGALFANGGGGGGAHWYNFIHMEEDVQSQAKVDEFVKMLEYYDKLGPGEWPFMEVEAIEFEGYLILNDGHHRISAARQFDFKGTIPYKSLTQEESGYSKEELREVIKK